MTGTNTARHRPLSAYGTVAGEFSSDVVSWVCACRKRFRDRDRWINNPAAGNRASHASRSRNSSPPIRTAPMAQAVRTPRPARGAMGRARSLVVAWMASPAVIGAICCRCRSSGSVTAWARMVGRWSRPSTARIDTRGVADGDGDADTEQGAEDEVADAAERGAQCRTVTDRHERVSVGCVEPAGREHEAPDHEAAGDGEQTGDARQGPATFRSLVVLRRRQPAGRRHPRPAATGVMPCDGAWPLWNVVLFQRWSAPAVELTWPDRGVPLRRNPAARRGRRNTVWCRVR